MPTVGGCCHAYRCALPCYRTDQPDSKLIGPEQHEDDRPDKKSTCQ
jgi:hypothetical protein